MHPSRCFKFEFQSENIQEINDHELKLHKLHSELEILSGLKQQTPQTGYFFGDCNVSFDT